MTDVITIKARLFFDGAEREWRCVPARCESAYIEIAGRGRGDTPEAAMNATRVGIGGRNWQAVAIELINASATAMTKEAARKNLMACSVMELGMLLGEGRAILANTISTADPAWPVAICYCGIIRAHIKERGLNHRIGMDVRQ